MVSSTHRALDGFSPATRGWFTGAFPAPTAAQAGAWRAIGEGSDVLVVAPTGSGKTLAAFLAALDQLASAPPPADPRKRCRVLYVSPLKALAVDVERNLRSPLTGIRQEAVRLGMPEPEVKVGIRSGDTPPAERRALSTRPPDILITTPESLFLMLTSATRDALTGVETVILDEVHAVAGTKRGAHLALSLERLDELLPKPARRIGLSATVRPVDEVARYLSPRRKVEIVQPKSGKEFDLSVVVPVEDLGELGGSPVADGSEGAERPSIWPHVEERIADLVQAHRSTIVFANSRRLAERLCNRLNEIAYERATGEPLDEHHAPAELMGGSGAAQGAPAVIARAHHGSVSKEQRALVEEDLKAGRLPAVVATSSLELGIDMGAVDLVVQVESPPSVASGLQRVGRAGHQVGAVSTGVVFPKYRGDLVQAAVVTERMRTGSIESLKVPANPLDVLAQQLVAMVALDTWQVDDLLTTVRRAAPFASLPESAFTAVLDMLAGRYPSDAFAELRPRVVWDRVAGTVTGRPGAQRLAVTSGGTIPDRGLFGVFLAGADPKKGGGRVGELDEEMVYESRVGDVFTLGTSSWRIEDITRDRVLVSPAPGVPGRLPFWKGDQLGRPLELGRALGAFLREVGALPKDDARLRLLAAGLDAWAADNVLSYLAEQREACGHVPDDRTIVVERFRDELGDWRVVVHSPFGAQVHAPWALALGARLAERYGMDAQVMHADDGIVLRLPDADLMGLDLLDQEPLKAGAPLDTAGAEQAPIGAADVAFDKGEVNQIVTDQVGGSALFASRFRECAARALLLPRRSPGKRTPLWQQRQRAAQLLQVASEFGSFPIVLEAVRECLQDVFDVPGLTELMGDIESRKVRLVEVTTPEPSPFARSLLFGYVAQFLYEGDSPLAERRAAALSLDSRLLAELLGQAELRELLDADVLTELERELQWLTEDRRVKDTEGVADRLRLLGPLTDAELAERGAEPQWAQELAGARRAIKVRIAGTDHWAAIEDAGRLRDALGTALPVGVPEAFTEPVKDPLGDLLARYARTHGPFTSTAAAARFGLGVAVTEGALQRLAAAGRVVQGEFHPAGIGQEWCDATVLRRLRRRSLAALRHELEPVPPAALAQFLPQWQHVGGGHGLRGVDGLVRAIEQLQGASVPASALEKLVLPSRVSNYTPAMLDELTAAGEVVWAGAGSLPGKDGWVSLYMADAAPLLLPAPHPLEPTALHQSVLDALSGGYGLFFRQITDQVRATTHPDATDPQLADVIWDLAWTGRLTNDTLAPMRSLLGSGRTAGSTAHRAKRAVPRGRYGSLTATARPQSRTGPPTVAGRWSLLPALEPDTTVRAHALARTLLDRHGVVTRGAVAAEGVEGGFSATYRVLSVFEESGQARRGYVVEGLGAAQFAMDGAVDRLRAAANARERDETLPGPDRSDGFAGGAPHRLDAARPFAPAAAPGSGDGFLDRFDPQFDSNLGAFADLSDTADAQPVSSHPGTQAAPGLPEVQPGPGLPRAQAGPRSPYGQGLPPNRTRSAGASRAVVLAAADPANAYGAALSWPEPPTGAGHKPGRKAGSLVVLVDGELALYMERGGKTLLAWPSDPDAKTTDDPRLLAAAEALAASARAGSLGTVTVERVNGASALTSPFGTLLEGAGFIATPRGLRLRA
ncbi:DEAD/DEAH box helicase [Streptomyces avermitilis]|uniref:ATP-dependent DNA helicase n=2 Tax=Streptomyces avermitilis TaxID=33903 RepID=Q82KA3_STRAW|nr:MULTISPECIES: ATP-dependent helicase [Streptomyces]KUN50487.1 DEAD/DEAH box helicase [Streptomyces avermitilis]MYS98106.1 ATP-dependent helicase [Streptomyces sp. SID5469]OOV33471.1 DEAD/DEAH box helicase [Streptomyces avermitilis]BAC70211.1 putative ATP-dependent DNA helicase [Streptomyces avermitilis MA-4680 = NBRC 14893]GDY77577.1 DEAD/DEAH box helicase [Streptomyces avermitilis]